MAELSWPSPDNARVVNEEQFEQMMAHNTEDGFYMNPNGSQIDVDNQFPIYANGSAPRRVYVRANRYANVRGFGYWSGETDVPLDIAENLSGTVRVDRVALELDRATWNVRAKIVQGTPGGSWPSLQRDEGPSGKFQVPVGNVLVDSGASVILASKVYTTGHRVGSRVRAWKRSPDIDYPKLGEIGYSEEDNGWFGWDGDRIRDIHSDTGWVSLSMNGPQGEAWSANVVNQIRKINKVVSLRIAVKRWSSSSLQTDDADGSAPIRIPAEFRPGVTEFGFAWHSRQPVAVQVETNGDVRLFPLVNSIPAGRTVLGGADWMVT